MWNLLVRNKRLPIALDVGSDGIRMLQMRRVGGALSVTACGRWRFPASAPADDPRRNEMAIAAVREMLKSSGFHGRQVISALNCQELSIKNIRLPSLPKTELAQAVMWEAKERLGFDVKAGQLSYLHAGQVRQGTETREEILVMGAPAEKVERHVTMLTAMGLKPEHIDAQPVAMFRGFERFLRRTADGEAVTVIVDCGRSGTRMVVARGRQILFIKSIDIGGARFTEAVSRQLHLTVDEADDLRQRVAQAAIDSRPSQAPPEAGATAWAVRDALRGEVESLGKELALCLRYCAVTFRGLRADRVTLTGGEAYDPAVQELLTEQLKVECAVGQPLKGIDVSDVDLGGDRRRMTAEWAVCAGLALRDVKVQQDEQEDGTREHRLSA